MNESPGSHESSNDKGSSLEAEPVGAVDRAISGLWICALFAGTALLAILASLFLLDAPELEPMAAPPAWGKGVAMHSCAPYDGAAFEIHIPIHPSEQAIGIPEDVDGALAGQRVIVLRVNERLRGPMTRAITSLGRPGGAVGQLCSIQETAIDPSQTVASDRGEPVIGAKRRPFAIDHPTCLDAVSGVIRIYGMSESASGMIIRQEVTGSIAAVLEGGQRLEGPFGAVLVEDSKPHFCG